MSNINGETIDGDGGNFPADAEEAEVRLAAPGDNAIFNEFTVDLFVNLKNEEVKVTRPYGAGGHRIPPGTSLPIGRNVESFRIRTASEQGYFSIARGD